MARALGEKACGLWLPFRKILLDLFVFQRQEAHVRFHSLKQMTRSMTLPSIQQLRLVFTCQFSLHFILSTPT